MGTEQIDIPALPVLLPLGAVLMVVSWLAFRGQGAVKTGVAWFGSWYLVAVVGATMLPMHLAWGPGAGEPEFYRIILFPPITTMRPLDFLLNTVMTLPVAALLHVLCGVRELRRVTRYAFLGSLLIESAQGLLVLTLHGQRWADVNDLISNTSGAVLGYLILQRVMRWEPVRDAVERATAGRGGRTPDPVL
ncbi:VanZ family protein [Actinoplanes sp. NPDC051851]|uniref:VanZ family protein n=1 Tax=Actinoplanes sp. NPDC051851 TaxID=3154753 RepID=UPI0034230700